MESVLIAGGGVVGLSAAHFLQQQGITPVLVERHRGISIHPRARGFNIRTMELYRELGLSESIREAGKALAPAWGIHSGPNLAAFMAKVKPAQKKTPSWILDMGGLMGLSPEEGARCTQDLSEPVLLEAARARGADIRFHTELVGFIQDADGVTATLRCRDTGAEEVLRARYMIAADGARSFVREQLGAPTTGHGPIASLLNIYFEADLGDFVRGREFSIFLPRGGGVKGMLTAINNSDRWVFHLSYDPVRQRVEDFDEKRIISALRQVIGLGDIPIRVLSVLPWQPAVKVATDLRHGRIFLAGDAAHTMTPYGGNGANTGIQDVHNLAWKLGAVLRGTASPALLDTYSPERQPIGLYNALQSGLWADRYGLVNKNFFILSGFIRGILMARLADLIGLNKRSRRIALRRVSGILGLPNYAYTSPGVYQPAVALDGRPGTRFPHCWVKHQGRRISTLDLLGKGFVLFTGADNAHWKDQGVAAVYSIGPEADLLYLEKPLPAVLGITPTGAILVRPDGFVVRRWVQGPGDLGGALREALGNG